MGSNISVTDDDEQRLEQILREARDAADEWVHDLALDHTDEVAVYVIWHVATHILSRAMESELRLPALAALADQRQAG